MTEGADLCHRGTYCTTRKAGELVDGGSSHLAMASVH